MNKTFSSFYADAVKDKLRKVKKGKYRGSSVNKHEKIMRLPGVPYYPTPGRSDAPSSSTYKVS